jgi:hypothetical protein
MKEPENDATRQERREKKQRKKKERIPQHGKSLGRIYTNAVRKRAGTKPE